MAAEVLKFGESVEVAKGLRLATTVEGTVERWELHNPQRRNAVTPAALKWIKGRCGELDGQVVVLGSSEGPFCSGFDLHALAAALARSEEDGLPDQVLIDATAAMRRARGVFIAAVREYAIGAGVELLACCDLRVMSTGSFIEVPAARLGVVYHAAGIQRLRAVFGGQVATRLLALADRIPAHDLLNTGALSHMVDAAEVDERAHQHAQTILGLDAEAVHHNLRLLRSTDDGTLDDELRRSHELARAAAYARARAAGVPDPKPRD